MLSDLEIEDLRAKHNRVVHVLGKPSKRDVAKALAAQVAARAAGKAEGKAEPPDAAPPWEVVIRVPTGPETTQFKSHQQRPESKATAQECLFKLCVVYPSREELAKLFSLYPGIADSPAVSEALGELLGFECDATEK